MNKTLKPIFIAACIVALIMALLAALKISQFSALGKAFANQPEPVETVSSFVAEVQAWPNTYTAVGTVEASEGIVITAEEAGRVEKITFNSGDSVKKGTVLLEQQVANERAQLNAAEAQLRLARTNFERMVPLRKNGTVAQSALDEARQQLDSAQGSVDNLKATLAKKVIRAPFDGRLGIRKAHLGQDLQVGGEIVSLQATNTVRVNFPVPQFWLAKMTRGLAVSVALGDGSDSTVEGEITAIGAEINQTTRNAMVQTYLNNDQALLVPGMAVEATVTLSNPQEVLAVPSTAIVFAPFGDTVFVIEDGEGEKAGSLRARQQFVRLGNTRGDFIEIADGLKAGEKVVSAGAFKLINGQAVHISSLPSPEYQQQPTPEDN